MAPKVAFMPVPAAGSGASLSVSGAHGKKDEPAAQAPVAVAAPAPASHPASIRMSKPVPSPATPGGSRYGLGVTGAVIGCLVGAAIWYIIAVNFVGFRILAWIPGIVGGLAAILLARKPSEKLAITAAIIAGVITVLTQMAVISGINDKLLTEASEESYKARMALAKKAAKATTDAQVRELIEEDPDFGGLNVTSFKELIREIAKRAEKAEKEQAIKPAANETDQGDEDELAEYRKKRLPELIKFSKGDPSRSRFIEQERNRLEEEGDILYRKKWITMCFWIYSSIQFAFVVCRGKKE